jgi:ADP-ribose pyrophosphatase YjhB (NUDIX family)
MEPIELAGCIIVDDYDRILLLHRYTSQPGQWELPGGKVEEEELPESAAVRELAEELGVKVELLKQVGISNFEQNGGVYKYYWFSAKVAAGTPAIMEADKFDELDYFDYEDLASLSLSLNMYELLDRILSGEVVLS